MKKALNINGYFIIFVNEKEADIFLKGYNVFDTHTSTDLESFAEEKGFGIVNLENESDIDQSRLFQNLNAPIPKDRYFDTLLDNMGNEFKRYEIDGYCRNEYGLSFEVMNIITSE